jgi:hypothetical protein
VTLTARHRRTLRAIFAHPISANIRWTQIEALITALGGEIEEGGGSRIHVLLNGRAATFHRPHPRPSADKGAVAAVRRFLEVAGLDREE